MPAKRNDHLMGFYLYITGVVALSTLAGRHFYED